MIIPTSRSEQGVDFVDKDLKAMITVSKSERISAPLGRTILGSSLRASENKPATSLLDSPNHLLVLVVAR
jgi:hypothetical protein